MDPPAELLCVCCVAVSHSGECNCTSVTWVATAVSAMMSGNFIDVPRDGVALSNPLLRDPTCFSPKARNQRVKGVICDVILACGLERQSRWCFSSLQMYVFCLFFSPPRRKCSSEQLFQLSQLILYGSTWWSHILYCFSSAWDNTKCSHAAPYQLSWKCYIVMA